MEITNGAEKNSGDRAGHVAMAETLHESTATFRKVALAFKRDTGLRQLIAQAERTQRMCRELVGPLADLRTAGLIGAPVQEIQKAIQPISTMAAEIEARFRLPKLNSLAPLVDEAQSKSIASLARQYEQPMAEFRRAMEAMRSPWLDMRDTTRSLEGFATLQGIGHILRTLPSYEDRVASSLRSALGDWREAIPWPAEVFADPVARGSFYDARGLDAALTAFPAAAFEEGVTIARLKTGRVAVAEAYNRFELGAENDDEEAGFVRTNAAHDRLQRFETQLRRFIDRQMTEAFGLEWIKWQVPGEIVQKWREKREKARQVGERDWPLIAYADFTDYVPILMRKDNWNAVFEPVFRRKEFVQESLQRLYPIRICTMHARLITQGDELYLYVETKRILAAIDIQP